MSNERYINVEKAVSILRLRSQQLAGMYGDLGGAASGAALILEGLADEEAGDVKPVVWGEWINHRSYQECSVCHEVQPGFDSYRFFCPNCGASMRDEGGRIGE